MDSDSTSSCTSLDELPSTSKSLDFECGICEKKFASNRGLKRHTKRHGSSFFNCHVCSKQFYAKEYLNAHLLTHSGRNLCNKCGKSFFSQSSLRRHDTSQHERIYKYKCQVCDTTFSCKLVLQSHNLKHHSNDKASPLFKCQICQKSYWYKRSLNRHILHCEPNKTIIECTECNKYFKNKKGLKQHQTKHAQPKYTCDICGKSFIWKNCLNIHRK